MNRVTQSHLGPCVTGPNAPQIKLQLSIWDAAWEQGVPIRHKIAAKNTHIIIVPLLFMCMFPDIQMPVVASITVNRKAEPLYLLMGAWICDTGVPSHISSFHIPFNMCHMFCERQVLMTHIRQQRSPALLEACSARLDDSQHSAA